MVVNRFRCCEKVLFMFLMLFVFLLGCDSSSQICEHEYLLSTVLPTCAHEGYDEHVCQKCGNKYIDNYIEKTNDHVGVGHCQVCNLDYFNECTTFLKTEGLYISSYNAYGKTFTDNPFDALWIYKINTNKLEVSFTKTTNSIISFFITYYSNSNGIYSWGMNYIIRSNNRSFQMEGVVEAQSLFDSTSSLSYTNTSFPDYLISDGCQLAASYYKTNVSFLQMLLNEYDGKASCWGYTNLSLNGLLK